MTGFNPISYHNGSVWPHDNAICAAGLMRYGFVDDAHRVMEGIVRTPRRTSGTACPSCSPGSGRDEFVVPGELPDVVLAAGVGGGVAAAVPAVDAALRSRRAQRAAAPRARGARVDRPAGRWTRRAADGRPSLVRGRRRPRAPVVEAPERLDHRREAPRPDRDDQSATSAALVTLLGREPHEQLAGHAVARRRTRRRGRRPCSDRRSVPAQSRDRRRGRRRSSPGPRR